MSPHHLRVLAALGTTAVLLSACKEEKRVAQYTVPKETRAAAPAASTAGTPAMNATPELVKQTAGFVAPEWAVPAGWRALPESPMRKGSWRTGPEGKQAEIAITAFPGDINALGGWAANVGRWCTQAGLPSPESETELQKIISPAKVGELPAKRVTLMNGDKVLTVVILEKDGGTWFFKIGGPEGKGGAPASTVATGEFDVFVASVKFPSAK